MADVCSLSRAVILKTQYGFHELFIFWYNSANKSVNFEGKDGNLYLRSRAKLHTIYATETSYWWNIRNNNIVFALLITHRIFFGDVDYFQWIYTSDICRRKHRTLFILSETHERHLITGYFPGVWKYGQFTSGHIGHTKMPLF